MASENPQQGAVAGAPRDRRPLYLRMYFQPHLTDLVRAVGYGDMPVADSPERLKPLVEKYGPPLMQAAGDEVLFVDHARDPPVVRLTDQARKLAVGLLGRPKTEPPPSVAHQSESSAQDATTEAPAPSADTQAPADVPPQRLRRQESRPVVRARRSEVLAAFAAWLAEEGEDHTQVDAAYRAKEGSDAWRTVDFIVRNGDQSLLIAVRQSLRTAERQSLLRAAAAAGDASRALRVWPVQGETGWQWRKHAVESSDATEP